MRYVNIRAKEMFEIMNQYVFFENKMVLDLGAGYCDIAMMAIDAGATNVVGIEKDPNVFQIALNKIENTTYARRIQLMDVDIELFLPAMSAKFDIVMCTSVLPYLKEPKKVLAWMAENVDVSIIEVQYIGDGPPGDSFGIADDSEMVRYLSTFWKKKNQVVRAGETVLNIRPAKRTIWVCRKNPLGG